MPCMSGFVACMTARHELLLNRTEASFRTILIRLEFDLDATLFPIRCRPGLQVDVNRWPEPG